MKISVVTPVYNVERYLRRSLDSVRNQTFGDWECVCVDDGSTDGSGTILDEVAAADSRFKVIHQSNGGVAAARNAGMAVASGDLVVFLDSDDVFYPYALRVLAETQARTGAEVLRYDWRMVSAPTEDLPSDPGTYDVEPLDWTARTESPVRAAACGAFTAVSKRLAAKIRWPLMTHCEDPLFVLRCFAEASLSVKIQLPLADYLIRSDSAARAANLKVITATCHYLPMAYSACVRLPITEAARADTVAFLNGFLTGPLDGCWRKLPSQERDAARRAVLEARGTMAACTRQIAPAKDSVVCDLVLNLGATCSCTDMLRAKGMIFETMPYDWVGRGGLRRRVDFIVNGFEGFLVQDRLEHEAESDNDPRHAHYVDRETGMAFFHEFPHDRTVAEVFPEVTEKYARRIVRFEERLQAAKRVLVVWVADPRDNEPIPEEDIAYCQERLHEKFPGTEFHFRFFRCPKGVTPDRPDILCGHGFAKAEFDYRNYEMGVDPWMIRTDLIAPYLEPFTARDPRPAAVRRQHQRQQRQKKYQRFGASSWLGCQWVKFQYKLLRHLGKKLRRKGVRID